MKGRNLDTSSNQPLTSSEKLFRNKTSAGAWLSKILKSYNCGNFIDEYDKKLLLHLLSLAPLSANNLSPFSNILKNSASHSFKIDRYSLPNEKRIVMLFVCSGESNRLRCQPLSKSKIINAIWPTAYNHLSNVKGAARNIIDQQIKAFRETIVLPAWCPISNHKLTNWKQIHIDHAKPFSLLFEEWLDLHSLNPNEIKLKGPTNSKLFADQSLQKSWADYHQANAVLQAVYSKANLSKGAKH